MAALATESASLQHRQQVIQTFFSTGAMLENENQGLVNNSDG